MKQAIVDGEPISGEAVQFELERLMRFYAEHGMGEADLRKNLDKLAERAQEQAIGAKLLLKRAAQLDMPVPEKMIDEQVERVVRQVGGRDAFVKALAAQKISEDDFRRQLIQGCRVDMLVAQACQGVAEPTNEEVEAHWREHQTEYVRPAQVLASHILVKTEGEDAADKAEALAKIKEIRKRIVEGGADFAAEAREHSDCPSGAKGGSLGWFGPGMMVPEFDKAAFAMKKGDVSDVVETQFGYHVIRKDDEKPGGAQTLAEVADSIRDLLRHQARGRATEAFVAELREKATIEYK